MAKAVKLNPRGGHFRSQLWSASWGIPIVILIFVFGILVPLGLVLDALFPNPQRGPISDLVVLILILSLGGYVFEMWKIFTHGASFHCPGCNQFVPHDVHWVCGYCSHVNTPNHKQGLYNHLFRHCIKCSSIPLGLLCVGCNKVIQLTKWAIDTTRYARVAGVTYPAPPPPPTEHPELVQLRRQLEMEKLKRQFQEEMDHERKRGRAKQMSSDIEILAEKISTTKQFELDALRMVQKLKDASTLDPEEEALLREMIKDKVMEEFHVDRRGGRSRYHPE
jgi:hypothetical protein